MSGKLERPYRRLKAQEARKAAERPQAIAELSEGQGGQCWVVTRYDDQQSEQHSPGLGLSLPPSQVDVL